MNAAAVFSPLDVRLNLSEHSWTRHTIEQALRSGIEIASYRRAADYFSELTHLSLSKSSLQRLVNSYGTQLVGLQAAEAVAMVQVPKVEAEVIWREAPEPESECMNISMDGAFIHLHFGTESSPAAAWVAEQKRLLACSNLRQLLHNVRQLFPRSQTLPESVRKAVVYLFHNRYRMRYKHFL